MICKKLLILFSIFTLFIFCKKNNSEEIELKNIPNEKNENKIVKDSSFIGVWYWSSADKSAEFTLKIKKIIRDSIYAQYCAVYNNGNKMDCDFDDINNVKGVIKKNKVFLEFNSFFGAKKGKAELLITNNSNLKWIITKAPKGEYFAPDNAILSIKNSVDKVSEKTNIISLPISIDKISILDYPTPKKYNKLQIDESMPTSVVEINKNVLILFFDGDTEKWYLVTLKDSKITNKLMIGKSETVETENGTIDNYIDFSIDKDLNITLNYSSGKNINFKKNIKTEKYHIDLEKNEIVRNIKK